MSRGGMSRNPFGGRRSLARLDLLDSLTLNNSCGEKLLYLSIIQDAAQHYLFFGLGKNGTTPEGFVEACNYFFKVRATDTKTWHPNRYRVQNLKKNGKKKTKIVTLTENQLKLCCFDIHFVNSGLEKYISIERFIRWLKCERQKILSDNLDQVQAFIDKTMEKEARGVKIGSQLPLKVTTTNIVEILTCPESTEQVAKLLLLSKHLKPPRSLRNKRYRKKNKRKGCS